MTVFPSVDWECGIKGLKSTTRITRLFTIHVGNDAERLSVFCEY